MFVYLSVCMYVCAHLTPQKMSRTHTHARSDKHMRSCIIPHGMYLYHSVPYRTYYPVRTVTTYWKPRKLGTPRGGSYVGYKWTNKNLENLERRGAVLIRLRGYNSGRRAAPRNKALWLRRRFAPSTYLIFYIYFLYLSTFSALSFSLTLSLSLSLSIYPSIYLSLHLYIYLSMYMYIYNNNNNWLQHPCNIGLPKFLLMNNKKQL